MKSRPSVPHDLKLRWLGASVLGVAAGGALWFAGRRDTANVIWGITAAVALVPLTIDVVGGLVRRTAGVDVIAWLALVGSLALQEYLAGAVISVMLASGQALESGGGGLRLASFGGALVFGGRHPVVHSGTGRLGIASASSRA